MVMSSQSGGRKMPGPVREMAVVVRGVLIQDRVQMPRHLAGNRRQGRQLDRWYRDAIKLAEDRYARFLATRPEEIR